MSDRDDVLKWVSGLFKCGTPERVDAQFEKLDSLDDEGRTRAVVLAEQTFVAQFRTFAPTLLQGITTAGDELVESLQDKDLMKIFNERMTPKLDMVDFRINLFQCQAQTAWKIHEERKEEASPAVQAIVRRASALSDDEFNSIGGVLSVTLGTLADTDNDKGPDGGFRRRGPGFRN